MRILKLVQVFYIWRPGHQVKVARWVRRVVGSIVSPVKTRLIIQFKEVLDVTHVCHTNIVQHQNTFHKKEWSCSNWRDFIKETIVKLKGVWCWLLEYFMTGEVALGKTFRGDKTVFNNVSFICYITTKFCHVESR